MKCIICGHKLTEQEEATADTCTECMKNTKATDPVKCPSPFCNGGILEQDGIHVKCGNCDRVYLLIEI